MILQARTEKALREVIVIAAGLSIQDPRERPMEKQQQADAAHRRFVHPDSDFLTILNIWDAYHDEVERLSQAQLRRFCRDHFLSYTRMREWRDIHAQLLDMLKERDDFRLTSAFHGLKNLDDKSTGFGSPPFRAIHRSILAGLLGNIAQLDEENGELQGDARSARKFVSGICAVSPRGPEEARAESGQRPPGQEGQQESALDHGGGNDGDVAACTRERGAARSAMGARTRALTWCAWRTASRYWNVEPVA